MSAIARFLFTLHPTILHPASVTCSIGYLFVAPFGTSKLSLHSYYSSLLAAHIRVERRRKGKKRPNVYLDDRGRADWQQDYEWLEEPHFGQILSKRVRQHDISDEIDPLFDVPFNEQIHGDYLRECLKVDHLPPDHRAQLTALIIEFWGVFNPDGVNIPVKDYECNIDTGSASPIRCKKSSYGPRESEIMMPMIDKLESLGQISQIFEGEWLSPGLLAPKPHQEHVFDIDDYVWRFCVNYIRLNQVTKVISYPIPRCDMAVMTSFGSFQFRWLLDAPQGFHQISVNAQSREKLAFAAPYTRKYTYNVMPFGPVNGPATFVVFIHDCKADWDDRAADRQLSLNEDVASTIIIDDIHGMARDWDKALSYLRCKFEVCLRRRLSLNLKKCHLFSPRFEFVGHDVATDGNHPASSKFDLVKNWPDPKTVRDVAALLGFAQFYACYIPYLEVTCRDLRALCTGDYNAELTAGQWTSACRKQWDFIKTSILADPCCARYDPTKRFYLKTDFAQIGMGYVGCQPDDDPISLAAMLREAEGGACEFLTNSKDVGAPPRLRPICMGSRRNRGYEVRLHSHFGESFTVDWALGQCHLQCWGSRFTNISDCYSMKFVLTYEGNNSVILRLQMRLMLWPIDIVHRTRDFNVDSDYMSKLALDTRFDPLLQKYLLTAGEFRQKFPPPSGEMTPDMLPGYRKPRASKPSVPPAIAVTPGITIDGEVFEPTISDSDYVNSLLLQVHHQRELFHDSFSIYPVRYHTPPSVPIQQFVTTRAQSRRDNSSPSPAPSATPATPPPVIPIEPLQNNDVTSAARQLSIYQVVLYGFGGGHAHHTVSHSSPCFKFVAAADMAAEARSIMHEHMRIPRVFSTARQLLNWIESNDATYVDFYLAHVPLRRDPSFVSCWWKLQSDIIRSARLTRGLQTFAFLIPSIFDFDAVTSRFCTTVETDGWVIHTQSIDFAAFGDSIDDYCGVILGVHRSTAPTVAPICLHTPPVRRSKPIKDFIHTAFNESNYAVSFTRQLIDQYSPDDALIAVDVPASPPPRTRYHSVRKYNLLPRLDPSKHTVGAGVFDVDHLFPPVSVGSDNIFDNSFGIEFDCLNSSLVRQLSPYEFVRGYGYGDDSVNVLALRKNFGLMAHSIPTQTSASIFDCVASRLRVLRDASLVVDESTPFAAPAATAQILFNGSTSYTLPDAERWSIEYKRDPQTALLFQMVQNPASMTQINMNKVHFVYRRYLRQSLIVIDNDMLHLHEPLEGSDDFTSLQIVPAGLQNLIFLAFHSNPVGGHFNAYRTFTRIRLRFFWPKMYAYVTGHVSKCAGCRLTNPTNRKSSELVYNFPVGNEPMNILHIDAYKAGAIRSYDNTVAYVVGACNMTSFGVMEGVSEESSTAFAAALMKFQLRYGFVHTIILDKDSKFYATFRETAQLLKIHTHTLSRENHDPMLVERINRYFNKFLKIFTAEHGSDPRTCHEGLLMALYAWNCANVPGTDISRCLMVTGREWRFPLDFCAQKHLELVSNPRNVHSFAKRQAIILSASRTLGRILIDETRAQYRELINSLRPDPMVYAVDDYVLARRTVQSKARLNRVGKLEIAYTGPWRILRRLQGASYECEHTASGKIEKFHASQLSPVPRELIPYSPVDTSDARYGQSHKPLSSDAYKLAGIEGFLPRQPIHPSPRPHVRFDDDHIPAAASDNTPMSTNLIDFKSWALASDDDDDLHFPSLAELQDEIDDWGDDLDIDAMIDDRRPLAPADALTLASPTMTPIPTLSRLSTQLISSSCKLFFISWSLPTSPRREWQLVRINLASSISYNPDCLHNGRFIVEFFICHPKDLHLHPRNQRWWLEYHSSASEARLHEGDYHLLRPDTNAESYARANNLHPFCQWVSILDRDTYIHGPFEFAIINGRQTRDRISTPDWSQLMLAQSKYSNAPPDVKKNDFEGVQFSRSFHTTYHDPSVRARVLATQLLTPGSNDMLA